LVLESYGVTVLKLAQGKVVLKTLLSPGRYATSNAVAGRQRLLGTRAIRCDCTKAFPKQGCTKSFTKPRVIHYLKCGCRAAKAAWY
jgi:hypothetical protein